MKKLILGAALAGTMTLFAGQAAAQDMSAMMAAMFPDPNGDGVTTKDEMLAAAAARFDKLDTDKDGKLSTAEISAAPGGGRMMQRADTNGDGVVTRDEMAAAAAMRFDRIDTNHDGKIDAAEKDAVMQMMQSRQGN